MSHRVYALRIAGYGLRDADEVGVGAGAATPSNYATTPDNRTLMIRFATSRPTQDGEGLWLPVLDQLPEELSWGVNPRTGESVTSTLGFSLLPDASTRPFFLRSGWRKAANLDQAIDASATTIYLDDGGAAENQHVMLGSECIQLRTHNGGGEYDCTRGALGTLAVAHNVGAEYDVEVYYANHGHNLYGRLVELTAVDGDASGFLQDNEQLLWRGVLRSAQWSDDAIQLEAASLLDLVRDGKIHRRQWRGVRSLYSATDDGAEQGVYRLVRRIDNRFLQIRTPHFSGPSTVISDGEHVVAVPIIVEPRVSDAAVWDTTLAATVGPSRRPAAIEDVDEVWEALPVGDAYGGNVTAGAADAAHPENSLPLSSDPYTLLLQLLTTTDGGGNGSYDVGPAPGLGLGVRHDLIDTAKFTQLSSLFGGLLAQRNLVIGLKGEPESFWELAQALLRPALQCLGTDSAGRLTVVEFRDSNVIYAGTDFDDDDVPVDAPPPALNPAAIPPTARLEVRYGEATGQRERAVHVIAPGLEGRWPEGFVESAALRLPGEADDDRAVRVALAAASRAGWVIASVDTDAMPDVALWPGDYARVTLSDIPGIDGTGGMAAEGCMVIGRTFTLDPWAARYTFLRVGAVRDSRLAGIHLAARVSSYSAPTATIAANAFVAATGHPAGWDQDSDAWAAALAVASAGTILCEILDSDLSLRGTATVTATGANALTLSGATVDPEADDVIAPAPYDDAEGLDEELFPYFVYMADGSGLLGGDNDNAYSWGF